MAELPGAIFLIIYNPNDWYWVVGGDDTQVYSSKTGTIVPIDNEDYQNWLPRNGGDPSRIDSLFNLREVFVQQSSGALARFDANQTLPQAQRPKRNEKETQKPSEKENKDA
jgi:hypothetical protein